MRFRKRKLLRWPIFALLGLMLLSFGQDTHSLNVAEDAASPYMYDLVGWEVTNFLSKWGHRVARAAPWASLSSEEKQGRVEEYFRLGEDVTRLRLELNRASAGYGNDAQVNAKDAEARQGELTARRISIQDDVEETIEAAVSAAAAGEGLATWGAFIFPPVDVRLSEPPKLLVTSPRERIERVHDVLLRSSVGLEQQEEMEDALLADANLSAVVIDIGGVATYPASIPSSQSLRWTLQATSHEWLHHYFFFRPLGQNMFTGGEMVSLNETVANIAGREIGDKAYVIMGGTLPPGRPGPTDEAAEYDDSTDGGFSFSREMRATRLRVDELLAEGKIEEAEAYMEERRRLFVENEYFIRKLNQAYFAFNGTYADAPSSVSPIGGQVREFRDLHPDVGSFVKRIAGISSYQQFLDTLEALRSAKGP